MNRRTLFSVFAGLLAGVFGCNWGPRRRDPMARPTIKSYAVSIHVSKDGWPVERVIWSDGFGMVRRMPARSRLSWAIAENAEQSRRELIGDRVLLIRERDGMPLEWIGGRDAPCRASGSRSGGSAHWTAEGDIT